MSVPRDHAASRPLAVDAVRLSEVVVVGTGVAGLAAALGSSPRAVTVLTKSWLGEGGSSAWAQGGVAAAVGDDDSPALHAADTLAVAGGLADPEVVELLTREGPVRIEELIALGARFDRETRDEATLPLGREAALSLGREAALSLGREAAHSRRRILHAGGDATGAELVRALTAAVRRAPGVRVEEECFAVDLAVETGADGRRRVAGVLADGSDGRRVLHLAGAVVLATGGLGQLFRHTTNPPEVTGDGLAMAARAGARLVDLEMVQFHPTALAPRREDGAEAGAAGPPASHFTSLPLLTEALRGEGAVLVDAGGRRFMVDEHPDAELAPRDVVARAIHRRREAGEAVFLDARAAVGERFPERFPTVFAKAMAAGVDPRVEPMPVTPAAHYHMGGVAVDPRGRASLPGLWVCGEAASTGAHGANRLASNSLLEALVFGARVAQDTARRLTALPGTRAADLERLRVAGRPVVRRPVVRVEQEWLAKPWEAGRSDRGADDGCPAEVREGVGGRVAGGPRIGEGDGVGSEAGAAALSPVAEGAAAERSPTLRVAELRRRLRSVAWSHVGLLRDEAGLRAAADELAVLEAEAARLASEGEATSVAGAMSFTDWSFADWSFTDRVHLHETRNLLLAGRLVATAALARPESRGAHTRQDHPATEPAWRRRLYAELTGGGEIALSAGPLLPIEDEEAVGAPGPAVSHSGREIARRLAVGAVPASGAGGAEPAVARAGEAASLQDAEEAGRVDRPSRRRAPSRRPLASPAIAAWGGPR